MKHLYTFRSFDGVIPYNVECINPDGTVVLLDTTCINHGPCKIQVKKKDNYYYVEKALNISAEHYQIISPDIKFFDSKEDTLIDKLKKEIKWDKNDLAKTVNKINDLNSKIIDIEQSINYLSGKDLVYDRLYYTNKYGPFKIEGVIDFRGKYKGFLVNWLNTFCEDDDTPSDIIKFDDNGKVIDNFYIFDSKTDYENYLKLENNKKLEKEIDIYTKRMNNTVDTINKFQKIINLYESTNISYEEMIKLMS